MKMLFTEPKKLDIEDKILFSTAVIGDHAKEGDDLSLFTVPVGQRMPQVPVDAHRCEACQQPMSRALTEADTNIMQAGQLGSAIGEARFDKVRAVLSGGDPVALDASFKLRIAGKVMLETTLDKLVKGWVQLEDEIPTFDASRKPGPPMKVPFVLVARTDTVEGRISLLREAKVAGGPLLVRIEIAAKVIKPVRLEDIHDTAALAQLTKAP